FLLAGGASDGLADPPLARPAIGAWDHKSLMNEFAVCGVFIYSTPPSGTSLERKLLSRSKRPSHESLRHRSRHLLTELAHQQVIDQSAIPPGHRQAGTDPR